jgi:hypothetical protein
MGKLTVVPVVLLIVVTVACAQSELIPSSPVVPTGADGTGAKSQRDVPVTTTIETVDGNGLPADLSSDGLGAYVHNVSGVKSILTANVYNGLTHGDWQFGTTGSTVRKVGHSFDSEDAVQPGDPRFLVPADPPYWGTQSLEQVNLAVACTLLNRRMSTMTAGMSFTCPMHNRFIAADGNDYHHSPAASFSGFPDVTDVQVVCNSAGPSGCNDWFIEPIGLGQAVARLMRENTRPNRPRTHVGTFYMRFRIHVTRP